MAKRSPSTLHARIHAVVRRIPRGRVASYGQVAQLAGIGPHPRVVGYALAALDARSDVPWQRVVNAQGRVSPRAEPGADALQRALLEREGIVFDARGRIDLARHGWRPRLTRARSARARSPSRPRRAPRAGPA